MSEDSRRALSAEQQSAFDQIWMQLPERQNGSSSSWWFFILFPEGEAGYGPKQMMFAMASRAGDRLRVNGDWVPGMDPDRPVEDGVDEFPVVSVGWYGDDQRVHEHIVNQPAEATLSPAGSLTAWSDEEDGARRGGEIRASEDGPGLDAHFVGEDCNVRFEAWGDGDTDISSPVVATDVETAAGGSHLVAWRRMRFEGEFDLPGGRQTLEGLCYFQRVCLNLPLFPWKWVWMVFPDGSAFSVMVSFVGPQLLRRGYRFFSSSTLERATLPFRRTGFWEWGDSGERVEFDTISVTPVLDAGAHPDFVVEARNEGGDSVKFLAETYGHARNWIDRPVLWGETESHWSYNEYLIRPEGLRGHAGGKVVDGETMGQGFGTLEYATGLGL